MGKMVINYSYLGEKILRSHSPGSGRTAHAPPSVDPPALASTRPAAACSPTTGSHRAHPPPPPAFPFRWRRLLLQFRFPAGRCRCVHLQVQFAGTAAFHSVRLQDAAVFGPLRFQDGRPGPPLLFAGLPRLTSVALFLWSATGHHTLHAVLVATD
jgi:hypothetical protein